MTLWTTQTLWNSYYYILASRKGYEADTLGILRANIQGKGLPEQLKASQMFYIEKFKGRQVS